MKTDIFEVVGLRGVMHKRGVRLLGVHPSAESTDPNFSQKNLQCATHCGVIIEIFESLWLLLKGQSGEIHLGVNTSITKEKV